MIDNASPFLKVAMPPELHVHSPRLVTKDSKASPLPSVVLEPLYIDLVLKSPAITRVSSICWMLLIAPSSPLRKPLNDSRLLTAVGSLGVQ